MQTKIKKDSATAIFILIAKQIKWEGSRFEPSFIETVFETVETLKKDFDGVEKLTLMINKREVLLNVVQTEFREMRAMLDSLKPLSELWAICCKFSRIVPSKYLIKARYSIKYLT